MCVILKSHLGVDLTRISLKQNHYPPATHTRRQGRQNAMKRAGAELLKKGNRLVGLWGAPVPTPPVHAIKNLHIKAIPKMTITD